MYNNPYNFYPYMNASNFGNAALGGSVIRAARPSLFNSIRNIKWGSILTNTQKTLNVINQAIPVYYQIKPIASNLRSFGKIMSAFNSPDTPSSQTTTQEVTKEVKEKENLPTFFID